MIIGFAGKKGSGKDTAAAELVSQFDFYQTSFAKALYKEVADAFGIEVAELEIRELKELPSPALKLTSCKDEKFHGIAHQCLTDEYSRPGWKGFMVSPTDRHFYLSPRKALQLWGTEYRRAEDNNYWINLLEKDIVGHGKVVISDVREPHEVEFISFIGGFTYKIVRPDNPYENVGSAAHSSETQVDGLRSDRTIWNKDLARFKEEVAYAALADSGFNL